MNWLRRAAPLLPICLLAVFAASCGFFVSNSSIETVTISPTAVLLQAGASPADTYKTLTSTSLTAGGASATDTTTATWASSNTSVVTVNAGVLTTGTDTTGNNTATITAKDGGVTSNSCTVLTYTGTPPSSMSLVVPSNVTTTSLSPGAQFQLTVTAALNGNSAFDLTHYVTWTSNSTSIGTVSSTGLVTVSGTAGTFTITATATLGAAASASTITFNQEFTVI